MVRVKIRVLTLTLILTLTMWSGGGGHLVSGHSLDFPVFIQFHRQARMLTLFAETDDRGNLVK